MPKMNLAIWLKEYARICRELSIDPKEDMRAARLLQELLKKRKAPNVSRLRQLIKDRPVIIFGAGPSLEKSAEQLKTAQRNIPDKGSPTLICADGAVSALLENRITPDVVVTDLDGNARNLVRASRNGAIMLVHAHGDNMPMLKRLVLKLENVIGTTQTRPIKGVHNFFGFTDGDRCVSLAVHFGARTITMLGMDFGKIQGKYSKGKERKAGKRKAAKLRIGKRLTRIFLKQTR